MDFLGELWELLSIIIAVVDQKVLQKVVNPTQRLAGASLSAVGDICLWRASSTTKDSRPAHGCVFPTALWKALQEPPDQNHEVQQHLSCPTAEYCSPMPQPTHTATPTHTDPLTLILSSHTHTRTPLDWSTSMLWCTTVTFMLLLRCHCLIVCFSCVFLIYCTYAINTAEPVKLHFVTYILVSVLWK